MSQLSKSSRIDAVEVVHKSLGTWELKLDIVIVGKYQTHRGLVSIQPQGAGCQSGDMSR